MRSRYRPDLTSTVPEVGDAVTALTSEHPGRFYVQSLVWRVGIVARPSGGLGVDRSGGPVEASIQRIASVSDLYAVTHTVAVGVCCCWIRSEHGDFVGRRQSIAVGVRVDRNRRGGQARLRRRSCELSGRSRTFPVALQRVRSVPDLSVVRPSVAIGVSASAVGSELELLRRSLSRSRSVSLRLGFSRLRYSRQLLTPSRSGSPRRESLCTDRR